MALRSAFWSEKTVMPEPYFLTELEKTSREHIEASRVIFETVKTLADVADALPNEERFSKLKEQLETAMDNLLAVGTNLSDRANAAADAMLDGLQSVRGLKGTDAI